MADKNLLFFDFTKKLTNLFFKILGLMILIFSNKKTGLELPKPKGPAF